MLTKVIFVFLLASLAIAAIKRPSIAIVGALSMFAVEQWAQASDPLFLRNNTLVNISFGSLFLWALVIRFVRGQRVLYPVTQVWAVVLLIYLYACISAFWAPEAAGAPDLVLKRLPYILSLLVLIPMLVPRSKDLQTSYSVQVLVGGALVFYLLLYAEWGHRSINIGRVEGNPLAIAQMAAYTGICALFLKRKIPGLGMILAGSVIILCTLVILRSGSRGQLIAFILGALLAWPIMYNIKNFKQYIAMGILGVVIAQIVMFGVNEFWGNTDRWSSESMSSAYVGRLNNAFVLLEYWLEDPFAIIFGLGNSASYDPRILGIYPHFVPLEILAEEGLVGFALYLLILFYVFKDYTLTFRLREMSPEYRIGAAVTVGMLVVSFVLSLKQGSLLINQEFFMLAIVLSKLNELERNAVLVRLRRKKRESMEHQSIDITEGSLSEKRNEAT